MTKLEALEIVLAAIDGKRLSRVHTVNVAAALKTLGLEYRDAYYIILRYTPVRGDWLLSAVYNVYHPEHEGIDDH